MQQENILDDIEYEIRKHSFFDRDEKYVANALWLAGTYLLKQDSIKVFNAFPMLAFMSPEPDSGKSRALKVTELLACNAIANGSYTTASLLAKIDSEPEPITICLDEIDTIFSHGKDNSDLIRLLNLGYERGTKIVRMKRFGDGLHETPAYCPKAFAGLKIARLPGPTKTRTIIISLRPKTDDEVVERHIQFEALKELREKVAAWSIDESNLNKLKTVDLEGASFLTNRNEQIWEPLLAIAKVTSEAWYQRALTAAQYFGQQTTKDNLPHKVLLAAYRVFRSGKYPEKIHSSVLLDELHDLGIPKWIDQTHLLDHFSGYDPEITTRQMKIGGTNRNGYEWRKFIKAFSTYILQKETDDVERELGMRNVETDAPIIKPKHEYEVLF